MRAGIAGSVSRRVAGGEWRLSCTAKRSWLQKPRSLLSPGCRARSCSGSRTLIQQGVKACNFWEFLEIGLLPISSYSYTRWICTCLGSLLKLYPAGCCSRCVHQKRESGAAVFCFGRKRRDLVNLKLQDAPQCFSSEIDVFTASADKLRAGLNPRRVLKDTSLADKTPSSGSRGMLSLCSLCPRYCCCPSWKPPMQTSLG